MCQQLLPEINAKFFDFDFTPIPQLPFSESSVLLIHCGLYYSSDFFIVTIFFNNDVLSFQIN